MRSKVLLAATVALFLGGQAQAGDWGTTYGTMTLPDTPRAGSVRAPYSSDSGRLIGQMKIPKCMGCGVLVSGVWVEGSSAQRCGSAEDGSFYWGSADLEFNADYTSFVGSWNYCGAGAARSWTGKLGVSKGPAQNR